MPGGVQGLDRYAYVANNPLKYTDPSGHKICSDDGYCGNLSDIGYQRIMYQNAIEDVYTWKLEGKWNLKQLKTVYETGYDIQSYIDSRGGNGKAWINKYLGNTLFHLGNTANFINNKVGAIGTVPWKNDIYLLPIFDNKNIAHELGHVLDNNFSGGALPATLIGGGPADAMVSAMGGNPTKCFPRWDCIGIDNQSYHDKIAGSDPWPVSAYANHSVADDFADTFAYTIYIHDSVPDDRRGWMQIYINLTITGIK